MRGLWAGQWYSHNILDGVTKHILYDNCLPTLFRTRRQCREYIKERCDYIKDRKDLREEPHGWRLPKAVKVEKVKPVEKKAVPKKVEAKTVQTKLKDGSK